MLIAAPSPVESPQAKRQACSNGASGSTFASAISGITVYSAKVEQPMKWRISSPSREIRVVPSGRWPLFCSSRIARQRLVRGSRQWTHSRHWGEKRVTTWSPGASEATSGADRLDDAGALVAEHGRRVAGRVGAGGGVEVGVADAAGGEPDQHLPGPRLGQLDLLHRERLAELLQHRGAHLHLGVRPSTLLKRAASSEPPVASPAL